MFRVTSAMNNRKQEQKKKIISKPGSKKKHRQEKNYERQPKISPRAFDNNYKNIKAKEKKSREKKEKRNDIIH